MQQSIGAFLAQSIGEISILAFLLGTTWVILS
jgi:hypothetical protein